MKLIFFLSILFPLVIGAIIKESNVFQTQVLSAYDDVTRLQHSFGKNEPGQVLVGFESKVIKYPLDHNVVLTVDYPEPGVQGKKITAIVIYVNQTSTVGKAFVIDGGWDKTFVKFYVEANRTLLFDYDYKIYGKDVD